MQAFPNMFKATLSNSELKGFDRLLRTAVIYGSNAAGKTNLMRAMQAMQTFVIFSASTTGGAQYPYRPFKLSQTTHEAPSEFEIAFIQDGIRYEYGLSVGSQQIEREWLVEHAQSRNRTRGRLLFDRLWDKRAKKYNWNFGPSFKGERSTWSNSTRAEALFLSTATQLNSAQLRPVFDWFQKKWSLLLAKLHSTNLSVCKFGMSQMARSVCCHF